jgi:hypothetical protein
VPDTLRSLLPRCQRVRRLCQTVPAMLSEDRHLGRRQVLAGLAVAAASLAAGCTADVRPPPGPSTGPGLAQIPIDRFTVQWASERRLRDTYAATVTRHPGLAGQLAGIRADHDAHIQALEAALGVSSPPAPSPSASGTPPTPTPDLAAAGRIPATPAAALAALRRAEATAAGERATGCLAETGERAALLASISASEASHEAVLA